MKCVDKEYIITLSETLIKELVANTIIVAVQNELLLHTNNCEDVTCSLFKEDNNEQTNEWSTITSAVKLSERGKVLLQLEKDENTTPVNESDLKLEEQIKALQIIKK